MVKYYKSVKNGYILGIGKNIGKIEITEAEYAQINLTLQSKPTAPDGYGCRLKEDLTWELYELPTPQTDPEITDTEALNIITGGTV